MILNFFWKNLTILQKWGNIKSVKNKNKNYYSIQMCIVQMRGKIHGFDNLRQ